MGAAKAVNCAPRAAPGARAGRGATDRRAALGPSRGGAYRPRPDSRADPDTGAATASREDTSHINHDHNDIKQNILFLLSGQSGHARGNKRATRDVQSPTERTARSRR